MTLWKRIVSPQGQGDQITGEGKHNNRTKLSAQLKDSQNSKKTIFRSYI